MNLAALEQQFSLPTGLLDAVMRAESGGDPNAVSPKGAIGAFQFMPATAKEYGIDPTDTVQSAHGAARMLSDLLTKYNGDVPSALAAYNWGQGNVDRFGLDKAPAETTTYIKKVTSAMTIDPSKVQWDDATIDPSKVQWDAPGQTADSALGGTLRVGVPQGVPFIGGKSLDTHISLPASVEASLVGAGRSVADWINGARQALPGNNAALDSQVRADDAAYAPLKAAHPVASFVGEAAPYLAAGSSIPAMMGLSALGYGTPTERATRAGIAGLGGAVGKGMARALGGPQSMASTPLGDVADFANYAGTAGNKWGIPTTVGMNGSKTAQLAESVIANMPFVNGAVNDARNAAFQGFNRAVTNTFGENSAQITPELLGAARTKIGNTIGDIASRNQIALDPQLWADLQTVAKRAGTELTPDESRIVLGQVQNIFNAVDPQTGAIPGTLYKATQSKLGEIGKTRGGTISSIMSDARNALRDAMTRSVAPEDSSAWLQANKQYFNVQQVANAAKATPGNLSPSQLLTQVNKAQAASKFGGGNDLAELARFAKPTLTDQIPNSGTAQRAFMQRLLTNPLTGIAELGGIGYLSNETDHPYLATSLGLLGPLMAGRALAGSPVSPLTAEMLTRFGGVSGLLGYNAAVTP